MNKINGCTLLIMGTAPDGAAVYVHIAGEPKKVIEAACDKLAPELRDEVRRQLGRAVERCEEPLYLSYGIGGRSVSGKLSPCEIV
jgi:hypothetical protein